MTLDSIVRDGLQGGQGDGGYSGAGFEIGGFYVG